MIFDANYLSDSLAIPTLLNIESTTFVSLNSLWHHCTTDVLSAWLLFRNFILYRGDWWSIKFCENDSFRKLFLFFKNTFQYLGGISQDILVSHFDSRRSLSSANRRRSTSVGLNLLHEAKFQRFLSGKSVFLNSKFQIREFHANWMEWGEVLER